METTQTKTRTFSETEIKSMLTKVVDEIVSRLDEAEITDIEGRTACSEVKLDDEWTDETMGVTVLYTLDAVVRYSYSHRTYWEPEDFEFMSCELGKVEVTVYDNESDEEIELSDSLKEWFKSEIK